MDREIRILRFAIKRCFDSCTKSASTEKDFNQWVRALGALGQASGNLAKLIKANQELSGLSGDEVMGALSQALTEIRKEMDL